MEQQTDTEQTMTIQQFAEDTVNFLCTSASDQDDFLLEVAGF